MTHQKECKLVGTKWEEHFGWCPTTEPQERNYFDAWSYAQAWGKDMYLSLERATLRPILNRDRLTSALKDISDTWDETEWALPGETEKFANAIADAYENEWYG